MTESTVHLQSVAPLNPLVQSGEINILLTAPSILIAGAQDDLRCVSVEKGRELTSDDLRRTAFICSTVDEVRQGAEVMRAKGIEQLPYLHVEQRPHSADDWVELISEAAALSARYSVNNEKLGIRKNGKHRAFDVTIIVPVYGVEAYAERCATSLRDQVFSGRAQILFIDDGSKDRSADIIQDAIDGHPNMAVVAKPNGGAASARNFGIELAEGEYIGFVDGDDFVSPDYLDTLVRTAFLADSDISQADFAYVNASTGEETVHREWFSTQQSAPIPVADPAYPLMLQTPGIWRRLYRAAHIRSHQIFFNVDFRRHDDLPFNIEVLSKARSVAIARNTVYFYILGREGQDVGATDARLFIHFRLFAYVQDRLGEKFWDQEFAKTYLITLFSHHKWAYERINPELKPEYLRGMGQQIFLEPMPIGPYGRAKVLMSYFRKEKRLLAAALVQAFAPWNKGKPLPSDV